MHRHLSRLPRKIRLVGEVYIIVTQLMASNDYKRKPSATLPRDMMRENMRCNYLSILGVTQPIITLALHAPNLTLPFTVRFVVNTL